MRLPSLALALTPALSLVVACGGNAAPSPSEVRSAIHDDFRHILTEGKAASDASTASMPSTSMFSLISGSVDPTGAAVRALTPIASRLHGVKNRQAVTGSTTITVDPDAISDELENELFTDANYLGNGVYRVPASLVCKTTVYNDDGTTTDTIDPTCAMHLDQLQLRIRVASDNDGLRFFVQIDANHDEPLSVFLAHDKLAVTINLDDASDAMKAVAILEGQQAPNAELSGSITGSLEILGAAHASVALSFDRALSIKFADQGAALDGDSAYRVASAAAQVIKVDLDGTAAKAKLDVGLGETSAHIPGSTTSIPAEPSRDLLLAGMTVNASYQGNTLSLDNISLGTKTTTVKVGGQQALAIDLNANDGRTLSATITADPTTGEETLAVSPRLDLTESVDHALLGDVQPVYDVTHVALDGSLRGADGRDTIEVVTGSFAIATNPAQYGFAATAGQCVTATAAYDSASYTDYTQYSVGACL